MKKIKIILFDMDGVLIDAKDWHYEALNEALQIFGKKISRYDHLITFDGLPTRDKLKMLSSVDKLPVELHEIINKMKQKYTMKMIYNNCRPLFIHQYTLSKLKQQGYKMAVCSNSIRNSVRVMLEQAGILKYFDFYISNEDVKKGKPDPEMYLKAIRKFGVEPRECLILEDNENGIKAALASGANVLEVSDVSDVNYSNISKHINNLNNKK